MTTIDFNSELERRIEHHAFDRYRLELQRDGQGGYRLLDIGLNRPDYPLDGSYISLAGINDYLAERDKALTSDDWTDPDDNVPA